MQLRLAATGFNDAETYLEHLLNSPEEQQQLLEHLVVPETWFFRERYPFAYLREHVGCLLQGGSASQPLRLLSAPCSTGEEPYSMAMTLLDMGLAREAFCIDAIDISRQSIRRARQAVYGKHSFRGVSEAEQQKYFHPTDQGLALHAAIRQSVHFRQANLMVALAELLTPYDVIFCRNLLIYLEEQASQYMLEALAGLMKAGGLLIVGSAETAKVPLDRFEAIRQPFVFGYRRRDAALSPPLLPASLPSAEPAVAASSMPVEREPARGLLQARRSRTRRSVASSLPIPSPAGPAGRSRVSTGRRERSAAPRAATAEAASPDRQRFEQELESNPYSDEAYLQQSHWMLSQNRPQEALEALQKCLYLKPDSREALKAMIQLTRQLGQVERSRQFQGRLARLEP